MEQSDPRRRFPRIFLVGIHDLKELTGAKVQWENGQRTDVLDMSYTGIAVVRPSGIEFEKQKKQSIQILFSGYDPQSVEVSLIRETERIFGVQFIELSKKFVDVMDEFLSDKILGRNLRPVASKFFHPRHDFDHWLHGPNNTNLYIWVDGARIKKVVFEFGGLAMTYDGSFHLQKLEEGTFEDDYVVFPLSRKSGVTDLTDFLKRSLKVLSQIEHPPTPIWGLIDLISDRVGK